MIEVSDALAAAIEAPQRTVLTRVQVDWDGDGYNTTTVVDGRLVDVDDVTRHAGAVKIDRSLTTEMPEQVRVVDGHAAAVATVELTSGDPTDETRHAAWYFTRGSDSPIGAKERLRRPTTVDVGFVTEAGPQYVRRLTGLTRRLPTSSATRTAQLSIVDYRERLRAPVTLIPTIGVEAGCSGTWIVAQVLYANGVPAGPVPRESGSLIWVPCYGSLHPLRADRDPAWSASFAYDDGASRAPRFRTGPYVLAADAWHTSASDYGEMFVNTTPTDPTWTCYRGRVEMWVYGAGIPTTGGDAFGRTFLRIGRNDALNDSLVGVRHNGKLFYDLYDTGGVLLRTYSSTFTVPGDGGWHFVGVHFDHTAQTITFRLDGQAETIATAISVSEIASPPDLLIVDSWQPVSDIHLHDIPATTSWLHENVVIAAVLDRSRLELVACYEDKDREGWELLAELAAAEQAVSYHDEDGLYRYRTRRRLTEAAAQTVQRTLTTVDASLLDVDINDGIEQVRNVVQATYTPVTDTGIAGFVYTDTEQRTLPRGGGLVRPTVDLALSFNDPVMKLATRLSLFSVAQHELGLTLDSYIVATTNSDFTDDGGLVLAYDDFIYGDIQSWTPRGAVLRVTNGADRIIYVTAMGVLGRRVVVGNALTVEKRNQASIDVYGPQPLALPASQWIQSASEARGRARAVLGELKAPHPTLAGLRTVGDPRLQLGDRVAFADPDGTSIDGQYWLTSIADDVTDQGGYTQQVTARAATSVMRWGQGRWGTNTWGQGA